MYEECSFSAFTLLLLNFLYLNTSLVFVEAENLVTVSREVPFRRANGIRDGDLQFTF